MRLSKLIFNFSLFNYKNFICIYYLNKSKILMVNKYHIKYNWYSFYEGINNINFYYIFNNLRMSHKSPCLFLRNNSLYEIIELKRKSSIFKKNSDHKYLILNYLNLLKNNYENNNNFKKKKENNKKRVNFFLKNVDVSRRLKPLFKNNRVVLKSFYNLKYYRNFSLSKNIKQISRFNKLDMILTMEYSLVNILMKTDIFISLKDCMWFLKNSFISINSKIIKSEKFLVKPFDIVNVSHNFYYFNFYKESFNNSLNNLYKINLKLWKINRNRLKEGEFKESYPLWMDNYLFYKKDIPVNLEIDYISMSIIVLYYDLKNSNLNYLNLKFVNIYLNRLYNWKYII